MSTPATTATDFAVVLDLLPWFVALTVNVHALPMVSPSTLQVSGLAGTVRVHEHVLNTEPTFGEPFTR